MATEQAKRSADYWDGKHLADCALDAECGYPCTCGLPELKAEVERLRAAGDLAICSRCDGPKYTQYPDTILLEQAERRLAVAVEGLKSIAAFNVDFMGPQHTSTGLVMKAREALREIQSD